MAGHPQEHLPSPRHRLPLGSACKGILGTRARKGISRFLDVAQSLLPSHRLSPFPRKGAQSAPLLGLRFHWATVSLVLSLPAFMTELTKQEFERDRFDVLAVVAHTNSYLQITERYSMILPLVGGGTIQKV
jgi:hypothetical protein